MPVDQSRCGAVLNTLPMCLQNRILACSFSGTDITHQRLTAEIGQYTLVTGVRRDVMPEQRME